VTADSPSPRPDYARLLADQASLRGRTAFVAGGYGGIGEAIAWGLALAGARVAVAGRSVAKAEALASALGAAGHDAFGLAMDAHSTESIRAAVDAVAARFGSLDILVNCVGIQREQRQALLRQIPVGRFCEPEEFAHAVRFLASPLSGFITGEILDLNGGLLMD